MAVENRSGIVYSSGSNLTFGARADGDHDCVGISDSLEELGLGVVVFEEPIDRRLEVDGSEDAALETHFVRVAKKRSTALSQEADVGVKWNVQRG